MKKSTLYICLLFCNIIYSQEGLYRSVSNYSGIIELNILPNNTYICKYPNYYDFSEGPPYFFQSGTWFECNKQLVLNSYIQPDQNPILNVVEDIDYGLKNDNRTVFNFCPSGGFIPRDQDSMMYFGPTYIIINNNYRYPIPSNGTLEVFNVKIETFSILNFNYTSEQYIVKNLEVNTFKIHITIDGLTLHFPQGSYYKNKIFTITGSDTLYNDDNVNFFKLKTGKE